MSNRFETNRYYFACSSVDVVFVSPGVELGVTGRLYDSDVYCLIQMFPT